jgi:hypothetical protein
MDQDDDQDRSHQFLLMWCCEGLEFVVDITQDQKDAVWARLQGQNYRSRVPNLMHLELRARYNSQRFYEIYVVNAAPGITEQHLRELFESNPQTAAQMIRDRGTKIFGEGMGRTKTVIT